MSGFTPKRVVVVAAVFLLAACEQPAGPRLTTAPRAVPNADQAAAALNVSTSPEYQRARTVLS
ncbi:MAG TPA: hypothetical protein VE913_00490, partial [Longimicrobium sp.]|nr:hypothetical protein [Longimicrobium sp.]